MARSSAERSAEGASTAEGTAGSGTREPSTVSGQRLLPLPRPPPARFLTQRTQSTVSQICRNLGHGGDSRGGPDHRAPRPPQPQPHPPRSQPRPRPTPHPLAQKPPTRIRLQLNHFVIDFPVTEIGVRLSRMLSLIGFREVASCVNMNYKSCFEGL